MRRSFWQFSAAAAILAVLALSISIQAAPPKGPPRGDGPPSPGDRPRGQGPDGERCPQKPGGPEGYDGENFGPRPPRNPLERALDANDDHEISAEEIANAAEALKECDRNGDGKIDRREMGPPGPPHGMRGRGRGPGPGSEEGEFDGPPPGPPRRGGRGFGLPPRDGGPDEFGPPRDRRGPRPQGPPPRGPEGYDEE